MAYELVAEGGILDVTNLAQYEGQLDEGKMARLELNLRIPCPSGIAGELEDQLKARGIPDVKVETGSPLLKVSWRKGFAWLPVIVAIILALIVLAILIVGWSLWKEVVPEGGSTVAFWVLIGLGVIVLIRALRGRRKEGD